MGSGLQQTRAAHESDQPDRSFADGSGSMAARPASEKCAANRRASNGLYDKFCTFAETLIRAEEQAQNTVATLAKARGQLVEGRSNIVGRIEKMRSLGLSPKKNVPALFRPETEELPENE